MAKRKVGGKSGGSAKNILMNERFAGLRAERVKPEVFGAFMEMHAQPASEKDNLDGWMTRSGGWGLPSWPWSVEEVGGKKTLVSDACATCADNTSVAKGDIEWQDVVVETTATLLPLEKGWGGPAGLIFRFLDSQRFLAAVIDMDGSAKILRRQDGGWDVLAAKPGKAVVGKPFKIKVELKGRCVKADIGGVKLAVDYVDVPSGCVGFVGSRPVRFDYVKVTAVGGEAKRLAALHAAADRKLAAKRRRFGRPVVWKQIDTRGFGTDRRIRLGDLTGDGRLCFLIPQLSDEKYRGLGAMTAIDADGEILWKLGEPRDQGKSSGDAPVQIHDIDGDGKNEVVCAWGNKLCVLEGATGKMKYSADLPPMSPLAKEFKQSTNNWGAGYSDDQGHVMASAIAFADLAGRGTPRDVLLSDSYHTIVAMTPEFKELWRTVCSHGHYPQPYCFDGSGRDSVLAGYHHISHDGKLMGRVCMLDHQDAIYAGPLDAEGKGPAKVVMAGGDDGLLLLTPQYDIRARHMGHVQRLAIGRFRDDIKDMCVATILFHNNPGIISMFDSQLRKLWTKDFPLAGATLQPVNWDGSGVEQMLFSGIRPSQGLAGGLMDGDGEIVVPLPDDGGPGYCALAHDFDGDGLDELMFWDRDRIWIYHSDKDAPSGKSGAKKYSPIRPPLWHMSNFQSYWSRPAWK